MHLFEPLAIRTIKIPNRIGMSPMCQYKAKDGLANDWHFVHLGSRAVGGVGLVMVEATAVTPEGRITLGDLGLWNDNHIKPLQRITEFISAQGAVPGIQLAHAGRKASAALPWNGGDQLSQNEGGWQIIGPSPIPFGGNLYLKPQEASLEEIKGIIDHFKNASYRALQAGFKVLEIHAAHGYLLHSFYSPITNHRTDAYGGSFENRIRLLLEVVLVVRKVWPDTLPLFVRLSCQDWIEGGWTVEDSVLLARKLKELGVDVIDCSSGGIASHQGSIPNTPGYQVPFSAQIRQEAKIKTTAVGLITQGEHAEAVIQAGQADLIFMGRELLRDPYWPYRFAKSQREVVAPPLSYLRGWK